MSFSVCFSWVKQQQIIIFCYSLLSAVPTYLPAVPDIQCGHLSGAYLLGQGGLFPEQSTGPFFASQVPWIAEQDSPLWLRWKPPCVRWNDGELTICLLVCVSHEKLKNRNLPQPWKVMCQAAYLHIKTENEFACYFSVVCVTFRHLSIPLARNSLCSEKVFLCMDDWEAPAFCAIQPVHTPDAPCSPGFLLKTLRRLEPRVSKNIFVIF